MLRFMGSQRVEYDWGTELNWTELKGMSHVKTGTINDNIGKDIIEVEEIKMWQEYTEELYIKALNDPDNCDGVLANWSQAF